MKKVFIKSFTNITLSLGVLVMTVACKKNLMGDSSPKVAVEKGVSKTLAEHRKAVISDLRYQLSFVVPEKKQEPIQATALISFNLKENQQPLQLDFKEQPDHVLAISVNLKSVPISLEQEHLVIPAEFLKTGQNQVDIQFIAGDLSLNRNDEYLYTLLVPDRARTVFPSFDQPDLKATFELTLSVPKEWNAIANGPLLEEKVTGQRKVLRFQKSDLIPTYLFSFAAGKFDEVIRKGKAQPMRFLHRETDQSKLTQSLDTIFLIHNDALAFMERYTQIPYPFQKFDFVAIPDFQYGGMEHVGAIQYKASSLFLDQGATQDQKISRSSLIAHETAHMWFGDLVTMQWFNDVWMKEVFANFMADKITQESLANANYDLKFLIDHLPASYGVDRTAGANPIRQNLDNLQDAGSMYGNIIYHKAPVMMRQLERLMGEEAFQQGLREYLKKYAFGNATWPDLIQILDAYTPADLQAWNQVWVNEPGRPIFDFDLQVKDATIEKLTVSQKAEDGSDRLWPQFFEVALVYPDNVQVLSVNMNGQKVVVPEASGHPAPLFVLFNTTGQGYGVFPIDEKTVAGLFTLKDPVARASAYINLYENMLTGRDISPSNLLQLYRRGLSQEPEELNLKLMTGQLSDIFWRFLPQADRFSLAPDLEKSVWAAMEQNSDANSKKLLFQIYQSIALSAPAQDRLYQVWETQKAPEGVKLTEDDYTSLALALAVRDYRSPISILEKQLERTANPDRKKRLEFLKPALSADVAVRDAFFQSLKKEENREKEAWVVAALGYLHHPLRAQTSEKYLPVSLDMLQEIQQTGDIFFPYSWLSATFGSYQSPAAAQTVRTFLQHHPDYNPKLKAKILQAADNLFRAEKLVNIGK